MKGENDLFKDINNPTESDTSKSKKNIKENVERYIQKLKKDVEDFDEIRIFFKKNKDIFKYKNIDEIRIKDWENKEEKFRKKRGQFNTEFQRFIKSLDEIIENYFCGNYFTCCSAISPTIEKIIRNTYFKLGKSDIELYGKDNSLQKRKNLENLLKDNDIRTIYGEEFINYFSWLFNNDISYYNYRNSVCHGYKNYEEYNKIETTLQLFILILFLKKFYEYFDKIEENKKE